MLGVCLPVVATLLAAAAPGPARAVEVTASRFRFDPPAIEVEEGERLLLLLRSADGTHGFTIKDYGVKAKIPKGGEVVRVEFVAGRPGSFEFACSEYCGSGHRRMKGTLVVRARTK
ncbi:MAG TPA: cupredoxin domain-containing protein [Vicinamibacteria bacterium]|nr:cupredoxin domain-containing protein [Vicinamibacteria bacterium]